MISIEEPQAGAVIEQTDSGENHFILRDMAIQLAGIRTEIAGMKAIIEASHNASEALKQQAQEALEAHIQNTQDYMDQVTTEPPPDFYPFVELPAGTEPRDLPDGNRLFTLSDGMVLKTNDDHSISVIVDGEPHLITPGPGTSVEVSPGRVFELVPEWIVTTVEQAGIRGLPLSAQVDQLTEHRFSIELAPYRLLLDQQMKTLSVINPSGSIDILGITRVEGVGETITVRILADGAKGFSCEESGHGGLIESGGTIHLSMKNGTSLIVRFPDDGSATNDGSISCQGLCNLECEERDL
ncbi:hypothetical protein [Desulfatibacillum aliphaticivorans]|uniref:hypothetical protein n=1 Tax=Desulfatibacillum aliphaticivorans TaxID=218208 RepID=UPI00040C60AB|nr:hypothetical protein [Desulfatibacillum aliphaticivorans]